MERTDLLPLGPDSAGGGHLTKPLSGLTKDDVRNRIVGRAQGADRGAFASRGDHDLNPGMMPLTELRAAAVLVPLVDRESGLTVLLTQRNSHLPQHAGQIAFPGGRAEAEDADEIATALRETEEEIGLARDRSEPIGRLDRYITRTGFAVTPIVAFVYPPFTLKLAADEVTDAFEVPLDFILDAANRRRDSYEFQGVLRHFYVFPFEERNIWGATAGMLVNLAEVLGGQPAA